MQDKLHLFERIAADGAVPVAAVRDDGGVAGDLRGAGVPRIHAFRAAALGQQVVGDRAVGGVLRHGAWRDSAVAFGGGAGHGDWLRGGANGQPRALHVVSRDVQRADVRDAIVAAACAAAARVGGARSGTGAGANPLSIGRLWLVCAAAAIVLLMWLHRLPYQATREEQISDARCAAAASSAGGRCAGGYIADPFRVGESGY